MKKMLKYSIISIWCSLLVLSLSSCQSLVPEQSTPSVTRQLITSSLGWKELWRQTLPLFYNETPTAVVVAGKIIVAVNYQNQASLLALDVNTGQTIWAQPLNSKYDLVDSIAANNNQVILATQPTVQSFQVSDGHLMWETAELANHTGHEILPLDGSGIIRDQTGGGLGTTTFSINSQSGAVQSVDTFFLTLLSETDSTTYYSNNNLDLIAMDNQSHQPRWILPTIGNRGHPALIGNILIFQKGSFLTSLVGVEPTSGNKLWQTKEDNIVSNFIVISDTIYALTTDATVLVIDGHTGKTTQQGAFSGGKLNIEINPEYWLLHDESRIFVYFYDSQELIAFQYQ